MSTVPFHRPARRVGPELPQGDIELQQPPELPEVQPMDWRGPAMLLPGGLMAGGMVMSVGGGGASPGVLLMGTGMAAMMATQMMGGGADRRHQATGDRRDYLRFLAQARRRVRRLAEQQRDAMSWAHPDPRGLWSLAATDRLWERRPAHPDFAELRLGSGPQPFAVRLSPPQTKPVEDLDPVSARALRRFLRAYGTLADQPVPLYLPGHARLRLDGERPAVLGLARSLVAQLVTFHGPDDVTLAVCAAADRAADWDWVKWLPHVQHPSGADAAGAARLVTTAWADLERLLGPELADRGGFGASESGGPLLVVVADGGVLPARSRLTGPGYAGTVLLDLDGFDGPGGAAAAPLLDLEVTAGDLNRRVSDHLGRVRRTRLATPDLLSAGAAQALARRVARYEIAGGEAVDAAQAVVADRDLPTLLGLSDLEGLDAEACWATLPTDQELRVPIGTAEDGGPLVLDLKESAQGGMGPHGLLIGATGSGKSELLRTLVLALATTHSPQVLNLVLVDFKGGATFVGLEGLCHISAMITNLADEAALVARMREAISGELVRRQELLRAAGGFASRRDYERARRSGAALDPLPTLLVVVDEFSELISAHPEFIDLFVGICRTGRSLGVHLLLASQRLDEGRIHQLEGHLSYRIGLRTFSAAESRSVIGVPDAYELPAAPGNGYLRSDVSTLIRFRAAYVSGPVRRARRVRPDVVATQVVVFGAATAGDAPLPALPAGPDTADPAGAGHDQVAAAQTPEPPARTVISCLVERLAGQGPPAHGVWLAPLEHPPSVDRLLPPLLPDPIRGLATAPARHRLRVPVGWVDRPFEQVRDLYEVDLAGVGGHVGIAGGPQSGKSTLVRTLVCVLALTHTPREVQFLCLDLGGGGLGVLEGLPHVGSVTGRLDPERLGRTVAELTALMADRERRFAELRVDGMAGYRRAAAEGRLPPEENAADVFLVVDGWSALRQEFEDVEPAVRQLAMRGLDVGIHVVIAANRWSDIHHALRDRLGSQLELRLGDTVDSAIDLRAAAGVPARPGRGLTPEKLHFLAAVPRVDGVCGDTGLTEATEALVAEVAASWAGPQAMRVRTLPRELPATGLPAPDAPLRLALGLEESRLEPVWHDFAQVPHLTVLGDTGSGKTNLLRLVLRTIAAGADPARVRVLLVDHRRALFDDVPEPLRLGLAIGPDATASVVADAVAGLAGRVPGPDITPEQLRRRDWWSGPELFVVVDDFDLIAGPGNPLVELLPFLPQARDIGLHVVLARAAAGAMRMGSDPFLRRLQELNTPDLALSCPREEGPLVGGTRPRLLPPGRALLCTRRGSQLLQTALVD